MNSFATAVLALAAIGGLPIPTRAQTNPQGPPPPPRHEVSAEVAFVGVTGNASTNTFGVGYESVARPGAWVFRHRLAFVRNEASGALTAKSFLYTPRVERKLGPRLSAFGDYAFFRDRFAGVASRHTVTGGVSATVAATNRHTWSIDGGLGYLNEDRLAGEDASGATYTVGTRYKLKVSDTAELADDVSVVGLVSPAGDWRLAHTVSLAARIAGGVSLKVSSGVRYSHTPPPGFKQTDTLTSVALVAKFTRN